MRSHTDLFRAILPASRAGRRWLDAPGSSPRHRIARVTALVAAFALMAPGLDLLTPSAHGAPGLAPSSGTGLNALRAQEASRGPRARPAKVGSERGFPTGDTPPPGRARPQETLTLDEAVALLHRNNPEMAMARARVRRAAGEARQAGAFPNPSVGATHESLSGDGTDVSETYLTLTQRFEWPGRRSARSRAGDRLHEAAMSSFRADSARLVYEVRHAYLEAAASSAWLSVLEDVARVFRESAERAQVRFADGDVSRYERDRIRLERLRYERSLAAARIQAVAARQALGALVLPEGGGSVATAGLPGTLPPELDAAVSVDEAVERHPAVATARSGAEAARAEVDLARSLRFPDPALTGGYKTQSDALDGIFLGISMPLPLLDRKGGRIQAAESRVGVEESRLELARRSARRELERALARYRALRTQADLFGRDPVDEGAELLETARIAWEEGEMDLIELTDAARAHRDAVVLTAELRSDVWSSYYELVRASGGAVATADEEGVNP